MINLKQLDNIIQEAKAQIIAGQDTCAAGGNTCAGEKGTRTDEKAGSALSFDAASEKRAPHVLYQGESCTVMRMLAENGYAGKFQCIYLDPPFLSGADYQATVRIRSEKLGEELAVKVPAYEDTWRSSEESYFRMLAESLVLTRDLLSDTGLLWLHLDWHSVHYARVMLDEIFGEERFVNEIIWQYKSGGSSRRHFARKHDTILVYAKTADYRIRVGKEKSYNRGLKPYHFKGVEEFEDETGWYTLVNAKDVWSIDMVGRTSAERNGYATQKPLALMARIVEAGSEEGDLVGDFYCGSGGFLEAAAAAGRKTVGCDRSGLAAALTEKRFLDAGIAYTRHTLSGTAVPAADSTAAKQCPPDDLMQHLKPEDRAAVERIRTEDPDALVLFRESQENGIIRIVDVFGKEEK